MSYFIQDERYLLEESKKIKKALRKINIEKKRSDAGQKRISYKLNTSSQYNSYLKRANAKQFEFELTDEMFLNLKYTQCIYCGGVPTGFDRVDNSIGYTIENSAPCCFKCNMMKNTKTQRDFLQQIIKIYNHSCKGLK